MTIQFDVLLSMLDLVGPVEKVQLGTIVKALSTLPVPSRRRIIRVLNQVFM